MSRTPHTSVKLPGTVGGGIENMGVHAPSDMIQMLRSYAEGQKRKMEEILNAADEDFCVETYHGRHSRKNLKVLQPGRVKGADAR